MERIKFPLQSVVSRESSDQSTKLNVEESMSLQQFRTIFYYEVPSSYLLVSKTASDRNPGVSKQATA